MNTLSLKNNDIKPQWYLVDAKNHVLGRLATKIAVKLRGKDHPKYTAHVPGKNWIIVINAQDIVLTRNKSKSKIYYHHTKYPKGLRKTTYQHIVSKKPEFPLQHAVKGMLPKNRMGRSLMNRLKVYPSQEHPHVAQQPKTLKF